MRDNETPFSINQLNAELTNIRRDLKLQFAAYFVADGSDAVDAKVLDATLPLINEFITTETRQSINKVRLADQKAIEFE